jgi:phosphoenolpyruvate carboxykinase (ATP)
VSRNRVDASPVGLDTIGLEHFSTEFWNLRPATLLVEALRRREGTLAANGAFVALTGMRTGRSPRDKYVVKEPGTAEHVHWGKVNVPIDPERFASFEDKVFKHLRFQDVFVQDLYCGADPAHRIKVRVVTERAWHSLFVRQLFVRPGAGETKDFAPDFTVVCAPNCLADPYRDHINSETFVLVNFSKKLVLIGGTHYAGEMKKSIFTVMNFLMPLKRVLSMHCSANIGRDNDAAVFFGLSGTGKTTLSADPRRRLIGDDEHGWSDDGVFNFEGGCYAKAINLSAKFEPQIYNAIRFGCVLENVVLDPSTREPQYDDDSITENTRAAYPLEHIENSVIPSVGGHPKNVVLLTCDAFGVLPPVARLTREQAMYHFLSGYTAKVAGTERGVTEPQATFSTCFGAPFMILDPAVYAKLLGEKIAKHDAKVWLVNTGWTGGPHGTGHRMKLPHTRAMVDAILGGELDDAAYERHPVFGVEMPKACPEVPTEVLNPRNTWADGDAYDRQARELAGRFNENFGKFESAPQEVRAAGPQG